MSTPTRFLSWAIVAFSLCGVTVTASSEAVAQPPPPKKYNNPVDYRGDGYDRGYQRFEEEQKRLAEAQKADRTQRIEGLREIWPTYKTEIIVAGIAILAFLVYLLRN